jgi:toxin ParE1/3/4
MKLRFSRLALIDLEQIGEWIAKDNPQRAIEYILEIEDHCRRLIDFPFTGETVGRYQKEEIRRKLHGDHIVLYTVHEDTIYVVRVIHGAQDYLRFLD